MPTYEYSCEACGHAFERFQAISDKPVKTCPVCGKRKVQKLISAGAGIIFKGSGFYCTDYGGKAGGRKDGEKAEKASSESASKTSDAKTSESKPSGTKAEKPAAAKSD